MDFLKPALLFTAMACAVLSASFLYVWLNYMRRPFTLYWGLAWLVAVPHLACNWVLISSPDIHALRVIDQLLLVTNAFLMVCGCCDFVFRRVPIRRLLLIASPFIAWAVLSSRWSDAYAQSQIPNALLLGGSYLWTAWAFLRLRRIRHTRGALMVAVLFAAAGLHEFDYPLFGNVAWAAPVGYGVAAVLAMAIALSLLILILEESRADVEVERARLFGVLDALPVGVIMYGSDGVVQFDNQSARTLLDETAGTVPSTLPALVERLMAPNAGDVLDVAQSPVARSLQTGESCAPQEFALLDATAARRAVLVNAGAVRDAQSRMLGVVTVLQDVEEWKQFERQMVRTQRLQALGTLAAGVAHNFNNNLTLILGQAQLALRAATDLPTRKRLDTISHMARDSVRIVSRIQDLARARPVGVQSATGFDLGTLVHDVVELARPRWVDEAAAAGVRYAVEVRLKASVTISGYPAELREAVLNLVINALDAMPSGGSLQLIADIEGTQGVLRVTDDGQGMTSQVREHIFDPFFTTKGARGTGLGLSLVFGVVERHQGQITVQSEPGAGTTFILRFPLATTSVADEVPETPKPPPSVRQVLVVDDEAALREMTVEMLETLGYRATAANSGADALRLLEEERFDLVFTDLVMPGVTGWEIAEHAARVRPGLPVVLVTGWGQTISAAECEAKSVAGVLAKPYTLSELEAAVSRIYALHSIAA